MPLHIIRQDITKINVDAIVNAANNSLLGGGGVDGAIHRAAGPQLLQECKTLHGCQTGKAKITKGYKLSCKYIIHTVGPVYKDGNHDEAILLQSCYQASLTLAKQYNCQSIAFPLISCGVYRFPKQQALQIATETIQHFLETNDMDIYLVIFDKDSFQISKQITDDIQQYIDDNYVQENLILSSIRPKETKNSISFKHSPIQYEEQEICLTADTNNLEDELESLDESFSEMLFRLIDEKGLTDAQVYKKANIDRKLFSKIRSDNHYHPSKNTAIALAIALQLSLNQTQDMLSKAGYTLSHSYKFDIIIEYFIKHGNYNIYEINEALFTFDQSLLG